MYLFLFSLFQIRCSCTFDLVMGGYIMASSPEATEDKSDGSSSDVDAEDDDDSSPSDDEMST